MKFIERQIFERRQQPETLGFDPMIKGTSPSTNGTVADTHVIQVRVDFKSNAATVTRTLIRFHHRCCGLP
jgi:hypothetical protein